jgi:hypothetical protein
MHGGAIKKMQIRNKIMGEDMVPTILEILHMPVPDHCAGNVLENILND